MVGARNNHKAFIFWSGTSPDPTKHNCKCGSKDPHIEAKAVMLRDIPVVAGFIPALCLQLHNSFVVTIYYL